MEAYKCPSNNGRHVKILCTTEHQKWPKISWNSIESTYFSRRAKEASDEGRSPPQELEESLRSGLYLQVCTLYSTSGCSQQWTNKQTQAFLSTSKNFSPEKLRRGITGKIRGRIERKIGRWLQSCSEGGWRGKLDQGRLCQTRNFLFVSNKSFWNYLYM